MWTGRVGGSPCSQPPPPKQLSIPTHPLLSGPLDGAWFTETRAGHERALSVKQDRVFWWPLSCAEGCRVGDVEFCGGHHSFLNNNKKKTSWLWDEHQVVILTWDGHGPCLMPWAIEERDLEWTNPSDSWWLAELYCVSLANTCSLGLASYFSQIPSHRASLSLACKKMFPCPHAVYEADNIKPAVLFLGFSELEANHALLPLPTSGGVCAKIMWYFKSKTCIKLPEQPYFSTWACPPRQVALVIKIYLICIGATLSVKAEGICR